MASSEACCRWRRRDHIKPRETPSRSIIDVDAVMGGSGCGWAGPDADAPGDGEAGGGGRGRAEQKGRLKWSMNSWRATLFSASRNQKKGRAKDGRTCAYSGGLLGWR